MGTVFVLVLLACSSRSSSFNPETHDNTSLQDPPSNIHPNVIKELISIRDSVTHLLDTASSTTTPPIIIFIFSRLTAAVAGVSMAYLVGWRTSSYVFSPLQGLSLTMTLAGSYYFKVCTTPFWDSVCDDTKLVELAGVVLLVLGFIVLGPSPLGPSPFPKTLTTLAIGIVLYGAGWAASKSGGLSNAVKSAIALGFPDTRDSYDLVDSLSESVAFFGCVLAIVVLKHLDRARVIQLLVFMEVMTIASMLTTVLMSIALIFC